MIDAFFSQLSILNIPGSRNGNRRTANVCAVRVRRPLLVVQGRPVERPDRVPGRAAKSVGPGAPYSQTGRPDRRTGRGAGAALPARDFTRVTAHCETSLDILQQQHATVPGRIPERLQPADHGAGEQRSESADNGQAPEPATVSPGSVTWDDYTRQGTFYWKKMWSLTSNKITFTWGRN